MLYIIVNETAGSGAGATVFARVSALLKEKNIPFRFDRTEPAGMPLRWRMPRLPPEKQKSSASAGTEPFLKW